MEVRRQYSPSHVARRSRGVVVAHGSQLQLGDLAGCYTGTLLGLKEREAKRVTGFEAYVFPVNATHVVDPTDDRGQVPTDTEHEMAFVNEPTGEAMPNLTPMEYRFGLCRDRHGRPGVPYYAVRQVLPGEELTVCYGPGFMRTYKTVCSESALVGRWTELQERLLRPLLILRTPN
uniref:SET domain-containing protein n=1 Tax=Haptolina brevifila TaxID=156173 RepID=A0A7S2MJU8_9EUKA